MAIKTDICVIGAGSGGLTAAVGAAKLGAATILIEDHKMGGDCLNYGCVPSKSLLAAAKAAHMKNRFAQFGIKCGKLEIDHGAVHHHIQGVIDSIHPHDSTARMESLGIQVFRETAHFINAKEIKVGNQIIRARRYVIATGSKPHKPVIQGLDHVPYFTNETIFQAKALLPHLLIIGGGPIGVEMAQAHARLGSKVTLFQKSKLLPRDDQELVDIIRHRFKEEGINVVEDVLIHHVSFEGGTMRLTYTFKDKDYTVEGTHLLVATGREPNISKLQLALAGIEYNQHGIKVDSKLRTTNRRVYAIGDVIGKDRFTHAANYQANIVLRNILFRWPSQAIAEIPWVTYTDPELAHIGMTEKQAEKNHLKYRVIRFPFSENDRAHCERLAGGLIKVITDPKGRILGASICGPHAADLLPLWILGLQKRLKIRDIVNLVIPYPTFSEVSKSVAGVYYKPLLFRPLIRKFVKMLMHLR